VQFCGFAERHKLRRYKTIQRHTSGDFYTFLESFTAASELLKMHPATRNFKVKERLNIMPILRVREDPYMTSQKSCADILP